MKMPTSTGIDRPFPSIPASDRYLAIGTIEEARSRICRMIDRCEGLGVIIGPPGTGKTLLCQRIASQYRATHAIVMLGDIRVSSRLGLIQQVLFHLRIPHQGLDEQAMQLALVESLTKSNDGMRNLLLIIDEAQMLSIELLDEIRMLTNLIRDGRQIVQTILVGTQKLEDPLADPQMESLVQRIVARCYLHPMTFAETAQYLRSMLVSVGIGIQDEAVGSVHHACAGVPRLINQLMNRVLDFASLNRSKSIDDSCVQQAWADLQQLPSPLLEPKLKKKSSEIEFGELDSDEISKRAPATGHSVFDSKPQSECLVTERTMPAAEVFDFTPHTASMASGYVDMESILASSSIDCMQDNREHGKPAEMAGSIIQSAAMPRSGMKSPETKLSGNDAPVVLKTTNTTIVPPMLKAERKRQRDELFGIDFSDEMLVDVRLADEPSPAMRGMRRSNDPAAAEISLHGEILKMSRTAKDAGAPIRPAALPWAPQNYASGDISAMPSEGSSDVPEPMAVVWRDDEPATISIDDRDMLVIEDDVTVMVDPPSAKGISGNANRQPAKQIDQQYQDLFSRLRGTT